MSKLTDKLGRIGIHNPHNLVKSEHPFVSVQSDVGMCSCTMLRIKNRKFKDSAWYEHGGKSFHYRSVKERSESIKNALDNCKQLFPKLKMVKGPWRMTWVPENDLKKAIETAEMF